MKNKKYATDRKLKSFTDQLGIVSSALKPVL